MACVGRTKECTIVPSNHYGPIPGIPVGTMWRFRVQVPPDFLGSGAGPMGTDLPEAPAPGQGPPWGQVTGLDFRPAPSTVWLRLGAPGTGVIGFGRKVRPLALDVGARRVGLSCSVTASPKGAIHHLVVSAGQRVGGPSTSRGGHPRPEQRWGLFLGPGWGIRG